MQTEYHSLKNKHVYITGGGNGIGEAMVYDFHAQHAKVTFIDIDKDKGEAIVNELKDNITFHHVNLRDIDALQNSIKQAENTYGAISCLVNNAARDTRYNIDEVSVDIWDEMQEINIRHVFFACQAVRAGMKSLGGGSIINFTSSSFVKRAPNLSVYGAAKSGIIGMTRVLSRDLGIDNIRVNAIMPGWIITERQKELWFNEDAKKDLMANQSLKQLIMPEDVAKLALFLASDDSSMISAQSYVIDGGWV